MDIAMKRAEMLASVQFPVAGTVPFDGAVIRMEQPSPVEMRDGEPFFGGYMMDDMLEDMGMTQTDEDMPAVTVEDLL